MEYKTTYHAISSDTIEEFNEELKEHTNKGYIPFSPISFSMCYIEYTKTVQRGYSILLSKTEKIKK